MLGSPASCCCSVPAIFAISREPLVVVTSNVFAILGLRAMYFTLKAPSSGSIC
jgi:tellurite resistance protein TerC